MTHQDAVVATADGVASLLRLVRASAFPTFVIQLPSSLLLEVSDSMAELTGRSRSELTSARMVDYVEAPEAARQSLDLLVEGTIDGYTRRGALLGPDGDYQRLLLRITAATDVCPRTHALGQVLEYPLGTDVMALGTAAGPEATTVLGTVDAQWQIDRITCDVEGLLGYKADGLLGQSAFLAVHPEDVTGLLLLAAHAAASQVGAAGRIRLRRSSGDWVACRVAVMSVAGSGLGSFAFALGPVGEERDLDSGRVRELEDHLRRIAREVTSSGVAAMGSAIPTALEVPALAELTTREYEIVVRLASGQRISAIARQLFLSESTIRNHLTSAYRKFGVRSQAELLESLHISPEETEKSTQPSR